VSTPVNWLVEWFGVEKRGEGLEKQSEPFGLVIIADFKKLMKSCK